MRHRGLIVILLIALLASTAVSPSPPSNSAAILAGSSQAVERGDQTESAVQQGPSDPATLEYQGDIVVRARRRERGTPADPLAALNGKTFSVAQDVDRAVVGPVALAYAHSVPQPVRDGFRNFMNNIREPVVAISFILELKPGKAGETAGRFAINSVVGVAGLFDVAKRPPFNLPRRPNGFGDVLGYHGVGPGPYLFLPLIGPTTLRDAIGGSLDRLIFPLAVGTPFNQLAYALGTGAVTAVDRRIAFDGDLQAVRASDDSYVSRRELYLGQRRGEIEALHRRGGGHIVAARAASKGVPALEPISLPPPRGG